MYTSVCVGTGDGGGAFKRMFSKMDAEPTLQIKENLKHDLSFLDKYVNSRRPVPAKLLVQSIRLLKPEEKNMSIHVPAVGSVIKTDTDAGKIGMEETISCMYTSS